MDVSIIGCIVNGPGEALVSDLGLTGSSKKSGFYLDGLRQKQRFDNNQLVDQLEARIRAKAKLLDAKNKIDIKEIE
jgi:(E)-4-hydroxy-3-methylbut-2-enyl-diphosphate synthase